MCRVSVLAGSARTDRQKIELTGLSKQRASVPPSQKVGSPSLCGVLRVSRGRSSVMLSSSSVMEALAPHFCVAVGVFLPAMTCVDKLSKRKVSKGH